MSSIYNFYPGPSALPAAVREQTIAAIRDFRSTGIGILEISHRSAAFEGLMEDTRNLLRSLLAIPDSHEIIFTTGGATQQFSMVPINLLQDGGTGDYLITGAWAKKALAEATRLGQTHSAASSELDNYRHIPKTHTLSDTARYLHYTSNNTIYGTQYHFTPETRDEVLTICDASSDFCSMPIDFTKVDLVYAGAQKNVGTSGVTIVVAKRSLLEQQPETAPMLLQYKTYLESESLYNTPPNCAVFTLYAMLEWIQAQGGVEEMNHRAKMRAGNLYEILDSLSCYQPYTNKEDRSLMNVCFALSDTDKTKGFIKEAEQIGLIGIAGHRSLGGLRISLYNGIDSNALAKLCSFLQQWAEKNQ